MDKKFEKLINLNNRFIMATSDYEELLPLVVEYLNIQKEDLPTNNMGNFVLDAARRASREARRASFVANQGKEGAVPGDIPLTEEIQVASTCYEVLRELDRANRLDAALGAIFAKTETVTAGARGNDGEGTPEPEPAQTDAETKNQGQTIGTSGSHLPDKVGTTNINLDGDSERSDPEPEKDAPENGISPQDQFMQSNPILSEHADNVLFEKNGIKVYGPRYRGDYETDEEYVKFLEAYYTAVFGYLNKVIVDTRNPVVDKLEADINENEQKCDEALKRVNELRKAIAELQDIDNMNSMSPEDFDRENDRLNKELSSAYKNYRFYVEKLKDLNKQLEQEKAKSNQPLLPGRKEVPLLPPGKGDVPLLPPGKGDVPLLPPGKDDVPLLPPGKGDTPVPPGPTPPGPTPPGPVPPGPTPPGPVPPGPTPPGPVPPGPEPEPDPVPPKPEPEPEEKHGRRLEVILNELVAGLGIKRSDDKAYNLSNIQVTGTFKSKLKQGNYLYNTVAALNIGTYLSIPINLIKKLAGKIKMTKPAKERVETLKERINSLSEEDLMVIYKEYRADRSQQNRDMDLVNTLLGERIARFVDEKVAAINAKITELYKKVLEDFKRIVDLGKEIEAHPDREEELEAEAASLFAGKAAMIDEIEKLQREGREWYSGGAHGFAEDMKAAKTKMTMKGHRFSKSKNTDEELSQEEASLVQELDDAIRTGNDEQALYAFLKKEKLLSDHTVIKNSIFGKRSVGERYYQPLVTKVDYRNDPFITDLMGTVATVGGIINIVGTLKNIAAAKEAAARANADMQRMQQDAKIAEAQVHRYGQDIRGHSDTIHKGQQVQSVEDELAHMNTAERATLDETNWVTGTSTYRSLDDATHAAYNQRYADITQQMNDIANRYAGGHISVADALHQTAQVAQQQQAGFIQMLQNYQPTLVQYAATHPQFDLTGLLDSVDQMLANPNAIADMYAAQAAISDIGLQLENFAINCGPGAVDITMSMLPTVVGVGSAYIMAIQVAQTMQNNAVNGRYGNEVIDLIGELNNDDIEGLRR